MKKAIVICLGIVGVLVLVGGLYFWLGKPWLRNNNQNNQNEPIKTKDVVIDDFKSLVETSSSKSNQEKTYTSSEIKTDFAFNAIGPHYLGQKPIDSKIEISLKILSGKIWSDWLPVDFDDMAAKKSSGDETFGSLILTERGLAFQYQVKLKDNSQGLSPEIDQIKFTYLDSTSHKIKLSFNLNKAQAQGAGPTIYSRDQWGADPNLMRWAPEYSAVDKFVVHHTVTTNISNPSYEQSAASLRAIYYYHSVTNGWGDIGYNYVIDQAGRIFEGRAGGNAAVGAHAYGYNYGSVGISILGDYRYVNISPSTSASLSELIARKSYENTLFPVRIYGHRDLNATSCPGDGIYNFLPSIKAGAQSLTSNYFILAKTADNPAIYFVNLVNQKKIWIPSLNSFLALGFNSAPIQTKTAEELNNYSDIKLIKGLSAAVYLLSNNYRMWIDSMETLAAWGYSVNDINFVSDYLIVGYPQGANLTRVFKGSASNSVYVLEEGQKRYIPSEEVLFDWGLAWSSVGVMDQSFVDSLTELSPPLGSLVKSSTTPDVFLIDQGVRKWVTGEAVSEWGLNLNQVVTISPSLLSWRAQGPNLSLVVKATNRPEVYLVSGGFRFHVPSMEIFNDWGFGDDLMLVANHWLAGVTQGNALGSIAQDRSGTDPNTYLISQSTKKVFEAAVLNEWQIDPSEVNLVPSSILSGLANGPNVTWLIKSSSPEIYYVYQGKKIHVFSPATLTLWDNFGQSQITSVSAAVLNLLEIDPSFPRINYLMKSLDDPSIYIVDHLKRRKLVTLVDMIGWAGEDYSIKITALPDALISNLTQPGDNLTRIIKKADGPEIYLMCMGYRRWIPDLPTLEFYRLSVGEIVTISPELLFAIPQGGTVDSLINQVTFTSNGNFSVVAKNVGVLTQLTPGQVVSVVYLGSVSAYFVSANNGYYNWVQAPIQIVPASGVIEVLSWSDPNWNGSVNYNKFKGTVEVVYSATSNRVWVVNELLLEDYLKGISEEPNSYSAEFLKTMAIAERSYAYYHVSRGGKHAGEPFHLKNSRLGNGNDQVYAGYNFEAQAPNVAAAVNATASHVVTYAGAPVITPYFSRTDGRTRSALEVWGSNWPWCASVADPWWWNGTSWQYGGSRSLLGHGVGLSAQGARGFIDNNGWNYQQALSYYYTATGIGAIGSVAIRVSIYSVNP